MWREVLNAHIQDVQQRQRIALALGVHPLTLVRWASRISTPRRLQYLRHLPDFLPEQREKVLQSLIEEFPSLQETDYKEPTNVQASPLDISWRIARLLTVTPAAMRFELLCDTILAEAINVLDPHKLGIMLLVARCMAPDEGQKVRSLLVSIARGTTPWEQYMEEPAIFLGMESLVGQVVSTLSPMMDSDLFDGTPQPVQCSYFGDLIQSVIATPILHLGNIGGCLIALSVQPHSFSFITQRDLRDIASLVALSFSPDEFYPAEQIDLATLPAYATQKRYLGTYKQRRAHYINTNDKNRYPSGYRRAIQTVWSEIEQEVLQLSSPNSIEVHGG